METRSITLDKGYCATWTVADALREIIQNGLDTKSQVAIKKMANGWEVSDTGCGMKLSDLIIGKTSKASDNTVIGQFGEGIKIGCLVLTRNDRKVVIRSNGKTLTFSLAYDKQWEAELLQVKIEESNTFIGTRVWAECSDEEIEKAKSLFLPLCPQKVLVSTPTFDLLSSPCRFWVHGQEIGKTESIFGWNLRDKSLINRDRNSVGGSSLKDVIAHSLAKLEEPTIIKAILQYVVDNKTPIEHDVAFYPNKEIWLPVITELFGKKVCIAHGSMCDLRAMEEGWEVLDYAWGLTYALANILPYSDRIPIKKYKKATLSEEDKKYLKGIVKLGDSVSTEIGLKTYKVLPMETNKDENGIETLGIFDRTIETVMISVAVIKKRDPEQLLATLFHEYVHGDSITTDNTRQFENALTKVIGKLAFNIAKMSF